MFNKIDKIKTVRLLKYRRGYSNISDYSNIAGYMNIGWLYRYWRVIQISVKYRRGYIKIGKLYKNRQVIQISAMYRRGYTNIDGVIQILVDYTNIGGLFEYRGLY